jgi:hypothetical protein
METNSSAGAASVTDEALGAAANRLVTEWVFPGDTCHSPDAITMAQAPILANMLRERMKSLAAEGINPLDLSIAELLPDVVPHEISVYDPDFD